MLLSIALMRFSTIGVRMGIVPFFPELAEQYSVGYGQIGILFSAYILGFALALVPTGFAADRIHPIRLMVPAVVITGLAGLGAIFTTTLWVAIICRFLIGVGASIAFLSAIRMINTTLGPHQRGRGTSMMELGGTFGMFFSMTAAPLLAARLPVQGLLLVPVFACFLAGLILFRGVKEPTAAVVVSKAPPQRIPLRKLLGPSLLLLIGLLVLAIGAIDSTLAWLATYLQDVAGLDRSQIGLVMAVLMSTQAIIFYPAGIFTDRVGRMPVIHAGGVALVLAVLLFWLLPFGLPLLAGAVLMGLAIPLTIPPLTVIIAERAGQGAGVVTSLAFALAQVSAMTLSSGAGWVIDLTGSFDIFWAGLLALLGLRIVIGLLAQRREVTQSQSAT